ESSFGFFKIFTATQALEHPVNVTRPESVVSQAKLGIELDRSREVGYRCVAVLGRDGPKDETGKAITTAQVFFVSFGIDGLRLRESSLLIRTKLEAQTVDNPF